MYQYKGIELEIFSGVVWKDLNKKKYYLSRGTIWNKVLDFEIVILRGILIMMIEIWTN